MKSSIKKMSALLTMMAVYGAQNEAYKTIY